jgi:short-subunit dehydrogenase
MRALVTGAGGGLGHAFAHALAARGCDLVLLDRDAAALDELDASVRRAHRVDVTRTVVDLSSRDEVGRIGADITAGPPLDYLVNNAGFMMGGSFAEHDPAKLTTMIDVHVGACIALCHAALPAMLARGRGAIINVASLGAFEPGAADVVYVSTKKLLIHFSLALAGQVRAAGLHVQALCPGLTRTKFHSGSAEGEAIRAMFPPQLWMSADEVVSASLGALDGRRVVCIPGLKNRLLRHLMTRPRTLAVILKLLGRFA